MVHMRVPWRALTALNTVLIAAQLVGGWWLADLALKGWPENHA